MVFPNTIQIAVPGSSARSLSPLAAIPATAALPSATVAAECESKEATAAAASEEASTAATSPPDDDDDDEAALAEEVAFAVVMLIFCAN